MIARQMDPEQQTPKKVAVLLLDALTLLRVVLVPFLCTLAWWQHAHAYFWLFVIALGSDAIDGFLARRLGATSVTGARLDSYADLLLFLSTPLCLYWLFPSFFQVHTLLLVSLLGAYLLADLIGYLKFRRLTSYHTYGAKLSALLLGAAVLGLFWLPRVEWLLYPSVIVAIVSYLEEIAITLSLPCWEANVPSLWAIRRRPHPAAISAAVCAPVRDTSPAPLRWMAIQSWLTLGSILYITAAVALLHLLRPDYNPLERTMSNYMVGPYGALMTSVFFVLALGLHSLAIGLAQALTPTRAARAGLLLLRMATIGFCVAGAVAKEVRQRDLPSTPAGYVHFLSAGIAIFSLVAALLALSAACRADARWRSLHRLHLASSRAALLALVAATVLVLVGWNGLGQRLVLAACLCWLVPTAHVLRSSAKQTETSHTLAL